MTAHEPQAKYEDGKRWLPVPGYTGFYEVSDHGDVRSLERHSSWRNEWGTTVLCPVRAREKAPHLLTGYWAVTLSKDGKQRNMHVHRLVAQAFLGEPPAGKPHVNHRQNPHFSNLEWVSPSENAKHAYAVLGRALSPSVFKAGSVGDASISTRISDADIMDMRQRHANGEGMHDLSTRFGCGYGYVQSIVTGHERREAGGPIREQRIAKRSPRRFARRADLAQGLR
jgi:hypothetical protein